MNNEIAAIIWKEWKEVFFVQAFRDKLRTLFAVAIGGIFLPALKGSSWFEQPLFLITGVLGPLLMLVTVLCDLFAGERERHTLETLLASRISDKGLLLGKLLFAISYATAITLLMSVFAEVTINVKFYKGYLVIIRAKTFLEIFGLNLIIASLGSLLGALVSLKSKTVRMAQLTLLITIFLLLFLIGYSVHQLSESTKSSFLNYYRSLNFLSKSIIIVGAPSIICWLVLQYIFWRYKRNTILNE